MHISAKLKATIFLPAPVIPAFSALTADQIITQLQDLTVSLNDTNNYANSISASDADLDASVSHAHRGLPASAVSLFLTCT